MSCRNIIYCLKPSKGYSSHGRWSTLGEIREVEIERGNPFPELIYPDDTPAIWFNLSRRKALRYLVLASEWERVNDETQPLTEEEMRMMKEDILEIEILPTDAIVWDDGEEGYLLLRWK